MSVPVDLGPRLRAVAEAVPHGATVADVGTDHAYLLAWLRQTGRIDRGIGIDVVAGPLAQARRTLDATAVGGVELRRGDGLAPLRPGEVDTVVIAGMGGARIMRLVDAAPAVVERLRRLLLQPNTDWTATRRWLARRRWPLRRECMVQERGHSYVVLDVDPHPGPPPAWDEDAMVLGPGLVRERSPAFLGWLRRELGRTERALRRVRLRRPEHDPRVLALRTHQRRLERALSGASASSE